MNATNQPATVLENLSASRMRIVVTDESGAEQCRCTLGSFLSNNRELFPRWRKMAEPIARQIRTFGQTQLNLGAGGVFTLRAEAI